MKYKLFSSFSLILFPFYFVIIFCFFPPFYISSLSFFLLFNPSQDFSFIASSSFIKWSLFLYHVFIIHIFLFSFISLSRLIQFFPSFIFANFYLSFIWIIVCCDIVLCSVLPLLIQHFPFHKVVVYLPFTYMFYSILLKNAAILIERFGQTCMTKEQSEMLMPMNHPFARLYIAALSRMLYNTDRNH